MFLPAGGGMSGYQYGPFGSQLLNLLQPMPMQGQQGQPSSSASASALSGMQSVMDMIKKSGMQANGQNVGQPRDSNGQFMSPQTLGLGQSNQPMLGGTGLSGSGWSFNLPQGQAPQGYMGYGDPAGGWGGGDMGGGGFMGYGG